LKNWFSKSDLKYTFRLLRKKPGFTLLSILVLAGGLGISILAITISYTMLYKPIPLDKGASIHHVCYGPSSVGCRPFKAYEFAQLRGDIGSLENVGIYNEDYFDLEIGDSFTTVNAVFTEWNLFELSGGLPLLGRTLQAYDHLPGAEPVAVLGHRLWSLLFNADEEVVGSIMELRGIPTRIVGVMPEAYRFPGLAEIWLPIAPSLLSPLEGDEGSVRAFSLLKDGVSRESASNEIAALMSRVRQLHPVDPGRYYANDFTRRLDELGTGHIQTLPMAAVGGPAAVFVIGFINVLLACILLLVCVNVGSLLLARTNERLKEVSIRVALGAPRRKLLLQTMGESTAICLMGGLLALLLAGAGLELINLVMSSRFPMFQQRVLAFWMEFHVDSSTLLAVLVFLVLTLYFTSILPCQRLINGDFNAVIRDGTRGALGLRAGRFSRSLVLVTVTLITLLVYVASIAHGAVTPFMQALGAQNLRNQVSTWVALPAAADTLQEKERFYLALDAALRQDPAVSTVSMRASWASEIAMESVDQARGEQATSARAPVLAVFGPAWHEQVNLQEGRLLNAQDSAGSPPAVLVNRSLADRLWPSRSPLGESLRFVDGSPELAGSVWRVVGVISDGGGGMIDPLSRNTALAYVPLSQVEVARVSIRVKATDPGAGSGVNLERAALLLGRFINDYDPGIDFILEYDEGIQQTIIGLIDAAIALSFGCVLFALAVALTGVYGLTQNSVQLMTQEIGTRRALGATDRRISRMLLLRGSRQALIALLVATLLISPVAYLTLMVMGPAFLAPLLVKVGASMVCLCAVIALAIYVPIRNILRMEPADALRYE
jgi:predicted permease